MIWENHAADRPDECDLGQVLRSAPPVPSQGQGLTDARVFIFLSRLLVILVGRCAEHAVPVAFLHGNLVAERIDEIVTCLRREAAEFDRRTIAANGLDPDRHFRRLDRLEAVEIRHRFAVGTHVVVTVTALAFDEGARHFLHEREAAGSVDVLRVPGVAVLVAVFLGVDEVIGCGECRQETRRGVFQIEDHGVIVGRRNLLDHGEEAVTDRYGAGVFLGPNKPFVRHHDIVGRQLRAVGERDVLANLEGIFLAVVRRCRNAALAEIAQKSGGILRIFRVDANQQAVERPKRVNQSEGGFPVRVVGRDLTGDDEIQNSAALWCFGKRCAGNAHRKGGSGAKRQH